MHTLPDGYIFTAHELASTLSVQPFPAAPNGTSAIIASVPTYPSDGPAGAQWAAAEILIPAPKDLFTTPYIYVSNRNKATGAVDSRGDGVAIFAFDKGAGSLTLVKQVFMGLTQVRGMAFGGAQNEWLVTGSAEGSGGIGVWERTDGGRDLELVVRNTQLATRTGFVWL